MCMCNKTLLLYKQSVLAQRNVPRGYDLIWCLDQFCSCRNGQKLWKVRHQHSPAKLDIQYTKHFIKYESFLWWAVFALFCRPLAWSWQCLMSQSAHCSLLTSQTALCTNLLCLNLPEGRSTAITVTDGWLNWVAVMTWDFHQTLVLTQIHTCKEIHQIFTWF